jgi:hypothetical protein
VAESAEMPDQLPETCPLEHAADKAKVATIRDAAPSNTEQICVWNLLHLFHLISGMLVENGKIWEAPWDPLICHTHSDCPD